MKKCPQCSKPMKYNDEQCVYICWDCVLGWTLKALEDLKNK